MQKVSGKDLAAGLEKATSDSKELSPTSRKQQQQSSDTWLAKALAQLAIGMQKELTREEAALYLSKLRDLPVEHLKVAFERAINQCKYWPKIAELRDFAEPVLTVPMFEGIKPVECEICGDTGWAPVTVMKKGKPIQAVEECECRRKAS